MKRKLKKYINTIIQGDCFKSLKKIKSNSISCVVTSPPYWNLRDYKMDNQLGSEKTFEEYINKLCDIFDEAKRVLRKDGTCFVNLGDTYSTVSGSQGLGGKYGIQPKMSKEAEDAMPKKIKTKLKDKCLCMIPQRFAIEMVNRGWVLRNVLIWHSPNKMPQSAKDRFTNDFEYVFFFVKSSKYYFETQYEKYTKPLDRWGGDKLEAKGKITWDSDTGQKSYRDRNMRPNEEGRMKRAVWSVNTKPLTEEHFAAYPEELIEPMIKAGCPKQICTECNKPVYKIDIKVGEFQRRWGKGNKEGSPYEKQKSIQNVYEKEEVVCKCKALFKAGIVLDPFMGSGTTGIVAKKLNRDYIGIELNPEYIKIAEKRIRRTFKGFN